MGNITLCAAITQDGVLLRHSSMGPYNSQSHIFGAIAQHRHSSKPQAPDSIHCHHGQCVIPPLCSGPELVSTPSTVYCTIPSTILSVSKPNQRVFCQHGDGGFTISGPRLTYPSLKPVLGTEFSACLIFAELSVLCTRL